MDKQKRNVKYFLHISLITANVDNDEFSLLYQLAFPFKANLPSKRTHLKEVISRL